MSDPWIGSQIGEYSVDSLLGEGGMGKVYTATGPDGGCVALKLIREIYARDETFRRRFHREARIAQTVKHPNVVPVLSTGEVDGCPYMAQRFIEGMSLSEKLKRDGPLDVRTAVRVCTDVADGLEALWAAAIVHRDLKPANILLDETGHSYITDFGLAKDTQGITDGRQTLLTLTGQAIGSMDYMAPEQIRGESVSAATDIYALGCVMYECICGRPPFGEVEGAMSILRAHLEDPPPDPRPIRPEIPEAFARTLLVAMDKDRNARPQAASEYAQLLAAAAG